MPHSTHFSLFSPVLQQSLQWLLEWQWANGYPCLWGTHIQLGGWQGQKQNISHIHSRDKKRLLESTEEMFLYSRNVSQYSMCDTDGTSLSNKEDVVSIGWRNYSQCPGTEHITRLEALKVGSVTWSATGRVQRWDEKPGYDGIIMEILSF